MKTKRRDNILYRLRKKGIKVHTRSRTVYARPGVDVEKIEQIKKLRQEFDFVVQLQF
ncbi:MAG: hypothetical protein PHO36_15540 [Parabacteroides sp.]|nr:hypothetical protein [Parabacteroides sp.]